MPTRTVYKNNIPVIRHDYKTGSYIVDPGLTPQDIARFNKTKTQSFTNRLKYRFVQRPEYTYPKYESPLTQELDRRKSMMFDYNNPNEINSYADIIMKTATGLFNKDNFSIKGILGVLSDMVGDTAALIWKGTLQPLLAKDEHGRWRPDGTALKNNTLVNFSETADLVDNVWKGFAMGSNIMERDWGVEIIQGPDGFTYVPTTRKKEFDFQGGIEGMKRAIFDRENFDWDTGNRLADFILEMATPTNMILWSMGQGAVAMGREAAEEAGVTITRKAARQASDQISKRALHSFAKNYTGDVTKTLAKMPMNLTAAETIALKNIAEHATNLSVLKGVNKIRKGVDIIDALGPRIAIQTTVGIPWKVLRAGTRATSHAFRYTANAVENLYSGSDLTLISTLAKRPEHEFLLETIAQGAKLVDEAEPVVPFNSVLRVAANNDNKSLRAIMREFNKTSSSKRLINEYIELQTSKTGIKPVLESAEMAIRQRSYAQLLRRLDDFAVQSSDGTFKTFGQYTAAVKTLYNVSDIDNSVKELYEVVTSISEITRRQEVLKVHDLTQTIIDSLNEQVNQILIKGEFSTAEIEAVKDYELLPNKARLKRLLNTIEETDEAVGFIKETKKTLEDNIDSANKEIKRLEDLRARQYSAAKKAGVKFDATEIDTQIKSLQDSIKTFQERIKSTDAQLNKHSTWLEQYSLEDINKLKQAIDDIDLKIKDMDELREVHAKRSVKIDISSELEALTDLKNSLHDILKITDDDLQVKIINKYTNFIDDSIRTIQKGFDATEVFDDAGSPLLKALDEVKQNSHNLHKSVTLDVSTDINDTLFNVLYKGKQGEDIADDIISKTFTRLKGTQTNSFDLAFEKQFTTSGKLDVPKFQKVVADIENIIEELRPLLEDEPTLYGTQRRHTGTVPNPSDLPEDVQVVFGKILDYISENLSTTKAIFEETGEVNKKTLSNALDELYELRNPLERIIREFRVDGTETKHIEALLDSINHNLELFNFTADTLMEYMEKGSSSYVPKLNQLYKNFLILKTEGVEDLLQALATEDWEAVPALGTIKALSLYDTAGIDGMRAALNEGNLEAFDLLFYDIFKRPRSSLPYTIEELKTALDQIIEVKEASSTIINTLEGMVSVRKLHNSVAGAVVEGLDQNVAAMFMDAIQRWYNEPATLVTLKDLHKEPWKLQYKLDDLFDNIEQQLRNQTLHKSVRLEDWKDRILDLYNKGGKIPKEAIEEYRRLFPSDMDHTAIADAYSESLIHKYMIKDNIDPLAKYVYIDVEASGVNPNVSHLYQKSVVIPETNTYKWYINTDVPIGHAPTTDHVYHLLFGDANHSKYTLEELKESFNKIYRSGDAEIAGAELKKYFPDLNEDIEIIFTKGEHELLSQSKQFIDSQKPPNGYVIYRAHNGLEYDIPLLNNRARALGVEDYRIELHNVEDTKNMLEDALGIKRLSRREREQLEDIVMKYIYTRDAELNVLSQRGIHVGANENLGKFLPTLDSSFRSALNKLENLTNPVQDSKTQAAVEGALAEYGFFDLYSELKRTMSNINETLTVIERAEQELNQLRITVKPASEDITGRLLPEDWAKNIPKELRANHLGLDLHHINNYQGMYVPVIGVNIEAKPNLVMDYFDVEGQTIPDIRLKRMTTIAGDIHKKALYIRNPEVLDSMSLDVLHDIQRRLLEELERIAGPTYFDPALKRLKYADNKEIAFATTEKLYSIYKDIAVANKHKSHIIELNGLERRVYEALAPLYTDHPDVMSIVSAPYESNIYKRLLNEYGDDSKFFTIDKPFEHYKTMYGKAIKTLEELDAVQDQLQYARIMRVAPIYRGMHDSFETFQNLASEIVRVAEDSKAQLKANNITPPTEARTYSILRSIVESQDALVSFKKVERTLEYSPEDMASYLRHQAKGLVIIPHDALYSKNYFPHFRQNAGKNIIGRDLTGAMQNLLKNRKAYEDLGISFDVGGDSTILYLDAGAIAKWENIPYKPITEDFDLIGPDQSTLRLFLEAGKSGSPDAHWIIQEFEDDILKGLNEIADARKQLVGMATDAGTSTLEVLDDIGMGKLLDNISGRAQGKVDIDTLKHLGVFESNLFNHTVLGNIDARRRYMPFSSFNPAKTMYNATQLLESRLSTQLQYIKLMQAPEFMVKNLEMQPADMVTYLKQAPHLKVAFLNGKTAGTVKDFKLSAITINSVKDIEFAKKMNAVVVDVQTFNQARAVINNDQIQSPLLRFMDKLLVGTFKIGWLAFNPGLLMRNIYDTATKNLFSTKDKYMAINMAEMTQNYFKYKLDMDAIYKYAREKKIHISTAIDEYFQTDAPRLTRETFDTMAEYQMHNKTIGMFKEAQKYYGDTIDSLYRQVGQENSGLSAKEFREFMKMPDNSAEAFLRSRFAKDRASIRRLMDIKGDLLTYKRAYTMHNKYPYKDLSVNDFVTFLKSKRVPPEYEDIFNQLLEETNNIKLEDDILTKLMTSPIVSAGLSANLHVEEILRMSMYDYLTKQGFSTREALAEIIRTHFDYDYKSKGQRILEMVMPFSTFRILNLEYWAEELTNNPQSVEMVQEYWKSTSQFNEREQDDVLLRRSLQYQMYTGNIILNEDTGLTMKLNPSFLDLMELASDPTGYATSNLHSAGQAAYEWLTMEQNEWETEEAFLERKKQHAWNMVPLVGSFINRWRNTNPEDSIPEKLWQSFIMAPLFNTTWTPAQLTEEQKELREYWNSDPDPYVRPALTYNKFIRGPEAIFEAMAARRTRRYPRGYFTNKYTSGWGRQRYARQLYPRRYSNYFKRSYPSYSIKARYGYRNWYAYSTFNRTMYGAYFKFRRGSAYPTKNYRSLNTAFSDIWKRSMTKKGNAKYRFLSFPTNKWTRQLKINILRNITSYNRWQ